jgi:hypothetical protein
MNNLSTIATFLIIKTANQITERQTPFLLLTLLPSGMWSNSLLLTLLPFLEMNKNVLLTLLPFLKMHKNLLLLLKNVPGLTLFLPAN